MLNHGFRNNLKQKLYDDLAFLNDNEQLWYNWKLCICEYTDNIL
jgi:hypothetical protein